MRLVTAAALVILAMFSRRISHASTDVQLVISSITTSGIAITSGTTVRIDNRVHGATVAVDSNRIGIEVQNQHASSNFWCAYDIDFTTATPNNATGLDLGKKVEPGDVLYVGLLRQASYFCMAGDFAAGTTVWAHVESAFRE